MPINTNPAPVSATSYQLAVSSTNTTLSLPANNGLVLAYNSGTKDCYVRMGTAASVAVVPVSYAAAAGTLTNDGTNITDGDTVTIDGTVYTFQDTLTNVAGHVKKGASNTASMTNLFHAINASGGTVGTDYATACVAHSTVKATNPTGTTVVVTALASGTAGNSIATTELSSHLSWGAATLASGAGTAGDYPLKAGEKSAIVVPVGKTHVAAICGGSDTTTVIFSGA